MSSKKGGKTKKHLLLAKLVTDKSAPCVFCQRDIDDEIIYGKLYAIGDIQCHYFCVLLSCCLMQKGNDDQGLFGFLYPDIIAEVERSKKHKCSYCGRDGATLGCSVSQCRKQFHLPCGRERDAVSLFYGNYKSFCQRHAPKQKVKDEIMTKARLRLQTLRRLKQVKNQETNTTACSGHESKPIQEDELKQEIEAVCVICYETVEGYPTLRTFWPPCCARDAWFHRSCLQRMALSAGMHYIKCPLCNEKETFYKAVLSQGYYVPDRDAAWELEQNAFSEIYQRTISCMAPECSCPRGRDYDADSGIWDIKLCILCGSAGIHAQCAQLAAADSGSRVVATRGGRHVCATCAPAAPHDVDTLADCMETVILQEESRQETSRCGPVMPSRMSLRRTKQRMLAHERASSSNNQSVMAIETEKEDPDQTPESNVAASRLELNLKSPKTPFRSILEPNILKDIENKLLSPLKMFEQELHERISQFETTELNLDSNKLVEQMRERFKKPKPLTEKKKIVNAILESLFENFPKEKLKIKEPVKEWNSPKKCTDHEMESIEENMKIKSEPNFENEDDVKHCIQSYGIPPITIKKELEESEPTESSEKNANIDNKEIVEDISAEVNTGNEVTSEIDESSNSTFQLPSEFIADEKSNDSLPIFDTPKKFKPVHVQKDSSMEISKDDQIVNIDVVKIEENETNRDFIANLDIKSPVKTKKCDLKFSPLDKEELQTNKLDIDVESFKSHYLNEVDKDFKCSFNHQHVENEKCEGKLMTTIDFAVSAYENDKKGVKRKTSDQDAVVKKKRRVLKKKSLRVESDSIKIRCSTNCEETVGSVDVRMKKKKPPKRLRKHRAKVSIRNENIQVKIKWKQEQFKLKFTGSNIRGMKKKGKVLKTLKQYVLKYSPDVSTKDLIERPEHEVAPIKKKQIKCEKSPDNLVQTSIQNFFKVKNPPN